MTALTISRVDGLLALWPLFVAFVLLLGVAYVAARGWYAVETWLLARRPNRYMAAVERGRGDRTGELAQRLVTRADELLGGDQR